MAESSLLPGVHTPSTRPWTPSRLWQSYFAHGLHQRPLFPPGNSVFAYRDTNYLVLGTLLERVCRPPLAEVYQQRIFRPLGLGSAYLEYYGRPPPAHPWP
ncbi:hypothetical protein GCM10011378_39960 [Hymenobacter glacieicola]|uniref:Beta-lactamase-related domain-containing protein n=1 Tax=Hymenobacter glacieicola TaxID=1562124 RepID=A0ABQ1X6L0_9BACT|nr:hypothetical protein GCM10011378_39960 [Hymenobacter glacieicola]